jgi:hypothetical protein
MWKITVQNLRHMPDTAPGQEPGTAGQPGKGGLSAFFAVSLCPGFTITGKQPCPSGAVMIGRLPIRILVTGILPLVGIMGIVEGLSMIIDEKGASNMPVRKTPDGSGN